MCKAAGNTQNGTFWYIAPTYKQAKHIAWFDLGWLLPRNVVRRSVENELVKELISGSRLQLIGADNEDSLRGPGLNGVGFDEAAFMKETVRHIVEGQLLGRKNSFAYYISSPNPKGSNWFSGFYDEARRKEAGGNKDWSSFFYTIYDNPTLNPEDIGKLKDNTPDDTWNLEYMAQESAHSGVILSEFDYTRHTSEFKIPGVVVRGIDWGIAHPTVCLWMTVDMVRNEVYINDEYVKSGMLIKESCEIIKQKTGERPTEWTVIDPSTNKRNSQTGRTDKDEFARYGVACVAGDRSDRGYDIMKMFFKTNKIKINPKCKNLIYEIRNVQYGDKEGDDCLDVLRYTLLRIHDLMLGKVFDTEKRQPIQYTEESLKSRREINFNNPYMFPKQEVQQNMSWLYSGD